MENVNSRDMTPEEIASAKEERRKELERTFSHDGYYVIRKELFAHQRDPAMTIRSGSITFNTACINGLEEVVYVRFEINDKLKRIAIVPCDENDKDAVRWCIAKPDKRKSRKITCPDLTDMIYNLMAWDRAYRYKMLGYKIEPDGETMYVFDLLISERTKNTPRRRKGEEAAVVEGTEAMEPIEGEEGAPAEQEETKTTAKPTADDRFPADVAGSFGVPVDQHKRETEVTELDGFVTAAMLTGGKSDQEGT